MSFEKALAHVLSFEGGYVNDPCDHGGETFRGISRKNWSSWLGWRLIDEAKKEHSKNQDIDKYFVGDKKMDDSVKQFYYENFWRPLEVYDFPCKIEAKIFDASINVGRSRALKFLQQSINAAGYKLHIDGVIGVLTKTAFSGALLSMGEDMLLYYYINNQKAFYCKIAEKPSQKKFLKGWLRRAESLPL